MSADLVLCDLTASDANSTRVRVEAFPYAPLLSLRLGGNHSGTTAVLGEPEVVQLRDALDEFLAMDQP